MSMAITWASSKESLILASLISKALSFLARILKKDKTSIFPLRIESKSFCNPSTEKAHGNHWKRFWTETVQCTGVIQQWTTYLLSRSYRRTLVVQHQEDGNCIKNLVLFSIQNIKCTQRSILGPVFCNIYLFLILALPIWKLFGFSSSERKFPKSRHRTANKSW